MSTNPQVQDPIAAKARAQAAHALSGFPEARAFSALAQTVEASWAAAEQRVSDATREEIPSRNDFREHVVGAPFGGKTALICFSIAAAFPSKAPTPQQLMKRFDMNRATAYRYLAALKAARGEI